MSNRNNKRWWLRGAKKHARKRLLQRRRRKAYLKRKHLERPKERTRLRNSQLERVTVAAPERFSFVDNPEKVSEFLFRLRQLIDLRRRIHIDMSKAKYITSDAVIMLIAHLKDPKFRKLRDITGSDPADSKVREMLTESGFFRHVRSPHSALPTTSRIVGREGKRINQQEIVEMIQFASQSIHGSRRKLFGVYRVYVEAMANTRDHAGQDSPMSESWWTTAYYDKERKVVCFCIVDTGVGIFESAKLRRIRDKLMRALGLRNNADILKSLLDGDVGSRTGLPYRGKGLPAMKGAMTRGQITKLTIGANDAFFALGSSQLLTIDPPLLGTVVSWEYDVTCK